MRKAFIGGFSQVPMQGMIPAAWTVYEIQMNVKK